MKEYSVLVNVEALEILPKTGSRRHNVIEFIQFLKNHHLIDPDYTLIDSHSGRALSVNIVGGFSIVWWADGSDMEVKVVEIEVAD